MMKCEPDRIVNSTNTDEKGCLLYRVELTCVAYVRAPERSDAEFWAQSQMTSWEGDGWSGGHYIEPATLGSVQDDGWLGAIPFDANSCRSTDDKTCETLIREAGVAPSAKGHAK